ncbi:hypothetical protein Tco_1136792 [Tanacetum coccineum]
MSAITDVKCVLSQKAFDAFCEKFHIPDEVHPVLPNQGDTMHERPTEKIGLYTRFFDFANFRPPFSTFLVNILRHFRINISQLSVIGTAKVSLFEILCRVYGITPTVGLFRCFYVNSKKNGWMSFIKRSDKSPKFPEEFLCLVGLSRHYTLDEETYPLFLDKDGEDMDLFAFIQTPDLTKVKVVERERKENEPRLLETTVGRTVPLLPVAPNRGESELESSVDKLFDEGGRGNQAEQGDSAAKTQRKRKTVAVDTGESSHPPKKLREDHGTPSGASVGGKSRSFLRRLLVGAVLNAEVKGEVVPTLPFVTSSVSATPEREGEDYTDSVTGLNLRTVGASQRFVISSDLSHYSGANVTKAEVDSLVRSTVPLMTTVTTVIPPIDSAAATKEKTVKPSLFGADSSSAGRTDPIPSGFFDRTSSYFLVGGIRTVIDHDSDL